MMQVSSSQDQFRDAELVALQHALPASETAQPEDQDEASREAQQGAAQTASQLVAEPRQQLLPEELPGRHTPMLHQAAGAAAAVAASTAVDVTAGLFSATPVLKPAVHQDGSRGEGTQPPSSSTPLYTCHLQGLGNASLALLGQEDAFSAGEQPLCYMNRGIITFTSGVRNADSEAQSTPAACAVAECSQGHAAGSASAVPLTAPCQEELDLAPEQYYDGLLLVLLPASVACI